MAKAAWSVVVLALAVAGAVRAQTPPPALPKGTNAVLGRVLDIGNNGPVGGAIVTLTGHFDASGKPLAVIPPDPRGSLPTHHVYTTGEGYFVFRNLPAGRYSVATRAFGYLNIDYPPLIVEIADSDTPLPVDLHLWKYAAISGRVFDERGEPVVGMPVSAMRRVLTAGRLTLQTEGAAVPTDDRGAYRIAHLPPGSYVVGVRSTSMSVPASLAAAVDAAALNQAASFELSRALINGGTILRTGEGTRLGDAVLQRAGPQLPLSADGAPLGYATTLHPGTTSPDQAALITLGSGEWRPNIDIPLVFSRVVTVSGVVNGPDGPLKNLTVRLVPPGGDMFDFDGAGVASAVTDNAGAFTFAGVTPGDYVLRTASVSGDFSSGEGVSLWAAQPVGVGDKPIAGLEVAMRPGVKISGELRFTGAPPPVISPTMRLPIMLEPTGSGIWRTLPAMVKPDLTFASAGDPPGRYLLNLFWNVFEPLGWSFQSATLGGKPLVDDLIELGAADVSGLVITMAPTPAKVSGSIAGGTGAADAGTDVIAFPADSGAWREGIFSGRRVQRVRATTARGFDIPRLAPGDYYIAAVSSKWTPQWQDPSFLERLIPGATRFSLAGSETKHLSLTVIIPRER
jgi:hypothetical protein